MNAIGSAALIRDAVNGSDANQPRSNRHFTQVFDRLVYNQIWEDPTVDIAAMEIKPHHRVVTICSAGCNALSYLTANPSAVFAVDLNAAHLALAELKRAAFDTFDDPTPARALFVSGRSEGNSVLVRDSLLPHLSDAARAYWTAGFSPRYMAFEQGFFRRGLLGHAIALARLLARIHKIKLEDALALDDADAQREWVRRYVQPIFKGRLVGALFSLRHPLFLLGIPPRQFNRLCNGNVARMALVLYERIEQLASVAKSSENYFLWQAFGRGYAPVEDPAVPPYLEVRNFKEIKQRVTRLTFHHESVTDHLAARWPQSLDRYVLLDAQDWMDEDGLRSLWQQMTRTARPRARVVFRTAGSMPPFTEFPTAGPWRHWQRLNQLSDDLHRKDRSGIYGGFHVYELAA